MDDGRIVHTGTMAALATTAMQRRLLGLVRADEASAHGARIDDADAATAPHHR